MLFIQSMRTTGVKIVRAKGVHFLVVPPGAV